MFNGLNQKTTNGGVNAAGKLTSAEWNNFIDELISELEKRASNIFINSIRHTAASHDVNLGDIVRSVKVNGVTVAAQNDGIIDLDLTNFYTKSQIDSMLNNCIISIRMNGTVYQPIDGIIELGSIISAIRYELSVNSEGQLIISYASSSDDFTMAVNNDGELLITY